MKAIATALAICVSLLAVSVVLAQNQNAADKPAADAATKYDPSIYAELQKAPQKARNRANPLQNDPDAVAAGSILFEQHCAECHGNSAQGSRKAPSLRAPEVQNATPGTLFWLITNGVVRKKMPVGRSFLKRSAGSWCGTSNRLLGLLWLQNLQVRNLDGRILVRGLGCLVQNHCQAHSRFGESRLRGFCGITLIHLADGKMFLEHAFPHVIVFSAALQFHIRFD